MTTPPLNPDSATDTTKHPAAQNACSGNPLYRKALKSLEKRVHGYLLKETRTIYDYDAGGNRRIKSETIVRKQIAPDLSAILFVLTNLDPQHWHAKPAAAGPDGDSGPEADPNDRPDLSQLSEQALREISGLLEP